MWNYVQADLSRILKKKSRCIILSLCLVAALAELFFGGAKDALGSYKDLQMVAGLLPFVVGLIEIPVLFGDEFKARSMQMAIGRGVSKAKVVNAKFIEAFLLGLFDFVVFGVVLLNAANLLTPGVFDLNLMDLFIKYTVAFLTYFFSVSISTFIMLQTQSTFLGILVFLLVASPAMEYVVEFIQGGFSLSKLHLQQYLCSSNLKLLETQWQLGLFSFRAVASLVAYFLASFGAAVVVFKHKELEL